MLFLSSQTCIRIQFWARSEYRHLHLFYQRSECYGVNQKFTPKLIILLSEVQFSVHETVLHRRTGKL